MEIVLKIFIALVGLGMIFLHGQMAASAVKFYRRMGWGEHNEKFVGMMFLLVGIVFVSVVVLAFFGIINFPSR